MYRVGKQAPQYCIKLLAAQEMNVAAVPTNHTCAAVPPASLQAQTTSRR